MVWGLLKTLRRARSAPESISISAIQGVALPIRQRLHSALTNSNRHQNQPPNTHPRTHPLRHCPSPPLPNTSLPETSSRLRCRRTLLQGVSNHLDTGRSPSTHPPRHDHCLSAPRAGSAAIASIVRGSVAMSPAHICLPHPEPLDLRAKHIPQALFVPPLSILRVKQFPAEYLADTSLRHLSRQPAGHTCRPSGFR